VITLENQIEVVRINRLDGDGSTKAFCDISLFNTVVIKGLRVVNGKKGLFVSMPREQGKDGKWYDTVHLLSDEIKDVIQNTVLEAYAA
jgi:stage V sporulation protein G